MNDIQNHLEDTNDNTHLQLERSCDARAGAIVVKTASTHASVAASAPASAATSTYTFGFGSAYGNAKAGAGVGTYAATPTPPEGNKLRSVPTPSLRLRSAISLLHRATIDKSRKKMKAPYVGKKNPKNKLKRGLFD
jgi:hypothetical protein